MRRAALLFVATAVLAAAPRPASSGDEPPAAEPRDISRLTDADPSTRLLALAQLTSRHAAEVEAALVDALMDPARPELHFGAAAQLGAFPKRGAAATAALETAWKSTDTAERLAAGWALGRLADAQGAMNRVDLPRPGSPVVDITPPDPALEAPKSLEPSELGGTVWVGREPIDVLGQGSMTIVFLRALPKSATRAATTAVHAAKVTRLVENRPGADGKQQRGWKSTWWFIDGILGANGLRTLYDARSLVVPDEAAACVRLPCESFGIANGRLVAPALHRDEKGLWWSQFDHRRWEVSFVGDLAKDAGGKARLTARPLPNDVPGHNAGLERPKERALEWTRDAARTATEIRLVRPLRAGEVPPKNVFPSRPTYPFAVDLDVERGCGGVSGAAAGRGESYILLSRPAPR